MRPCYSGAADRHISDLHSYETTIHEAKSSCLVEQVFGCPYSSTISCTIVYCNVRAIHYKRQINFLLLPCHELFCSLWLRLRHSLQWCRTLSMVPHTVHGAVLMVSRIYLDSRCRASCCRVVLLHATPCCCALWCRSPRCHAPVAVGKIGVFLRACCDGAAFHTAAYGAVSVCCRAISVSPRSMVPRLHSAALIFVLPRTAGQPCGLLCCRIHLHGAA